MSIFSIFSGLNIYPVLWSPLGLEWHLQLPMGLRKNEVSGDFFSGCPKKSSRVFQIFSNALSQNGKLGLGSNRFLNEDYICTYLSLVKRPDKVLETNR